jgi:1,4-dihydroxy-2-naphthoate octaprenyltransferase
MGNTSNLNAWLKAIRLRTLPLALASIAMGSFLAGGEGYFDALTLILAVLTTVFLQILSNLANDFGDTMHGADSVERTGPKRSVQSGEISASSMKRGIIITALLSFICGITLLITAIKNINITFLIFVLLGIGAILAALGYTMGKKPYGYAGLGDLFVVLFFGLVGVLGTCYLFTGNFSGIHILPAFTSGFFAAAVLNINNIRDIDSDRLAGKKSIPVRFGRKNAIFYHWSLLFTGFLFVIIYTALTYNSPFQLIFLITIPLFIKNARDVKNKHYAADLDPSLKRMAISSLIFTLCFGIGLLI